MVFGELTNLCSGSNNSYNRFLLLFAFTSFNIMDCVMTICIIHVWLGNYLVSHNYNPCFWKWKHTKVECIIMSQLVGLSIMSHGTKYKWIIFLNDSRKYYYMWYDHIVWITITYWTFKMPKALHHNPYYIIMGLIYTKMFNWMIFFNIENSVMPLIQGIQFWKIRKP
jgi:hypothetical protein